MKKWLSVALSCAITLSALWSGERPNIIWIFSDDPLADFQAISAYKSRFANLAPTSQILTDWPKRACVLIVPTLRTPSVHQPELVF